MKKLLFSLLLTIVSQSTLAEGWTVAELMQLPPFCRSMQGYMSNEAQRTFKGNFSMPEGWDETSNHLCGGMVQVLRGERATSAKDKAQFFSDAVNNLEGYTSLGAYKKNPSAFNQAQRNYYALIHYSIARAYKGLGKIYNMITEYQSAIKANPKLELAYRDLFDFYKKQGDKTSAIAILEQGLKQIPSSKALLKRKQNL